MGYHHTIRALTADLCFLFAFSAHTGFHLLLAQVKHHSVLIGDHSVPYSCLYAVVTRLPLSHRNPPIQAFEPDSVVHTAAYTCDANVTGDDAHPVDSASDRDPYICLYQPPCLPRIFLWRAGLMGSVDLVPNQCVF